MFGTPGFLKLISRVQNLPGITVYNNQVNNKCHANLTKHKTLYAMFLDILYLYASRACMHLPSYRFHPVTAVAPFLIFSSDSRFALAPEGWWAGGHRGVRQVRQLFQQPLVPEVVQAFAEFYGWELPPGGQLFAPLHQPRRPSRLSSLPVPLCF